MLRQSILYNFPQADTLKKEIKLIKLQDDFSYSTEKAHRHNYFELFYFTEGGGSHLVDFSDYPIHSESLHIVVPGALHLVKRTAGSAGYVLLFTKEFLYSINDFTPATHLKLWHQKPVHPLSPDENAFVQMSFAQMHKEFVNDRPYQHTVMASLLHMIFILMYRQAPVLEEKSSKLTERFFDLLEMSFTTGASASDYATKLGCSLKTLNRALTSSNHTSAQQCIIDRRMLEARRLLIHTEWSIKEVAFHLDFSDPDYFGKVFKAAVGESPGEFREKNT